MPQLSDFPQSSCSCSECQLMCQRVPCLPTPYEAIKLIKHGLAKRLMVRIENKYTRKIEILSPAVQGLESKSTDYPRGTCTFYVNGLCELHNRDLKPIQGRVALHYNLNDPHREFHRIVIDSWINNPVTSKLALDMWKKEIAKC